ncbi:MAG: DUF6155 family protein [Bacteroidales bacterium]|nr:DUF6155 family protein [Bacteroidales bacterium]
MSKAQLRKELAAMSQEQLIEVILEAYSARKETKEYFEYFLNPDPQALTERYLKAINKEIQRVKRGSMRMRVSTVKKLLKEYASFQPGVALELQLLYHAWDSTLVMAISWRRTDTIERFLTDTIATLVARADSEMLLDRYAPSIEKAIAMTSRWGGLRPLLTHALEDALESLTPQIPPAK